MPSPRKTPPAQLHGRHSGTCSHQGCDAARHLQSRFLSMTQWTFSKAHNAAVFVVRGVRGDELRMWDGEVDRTHLLTYTDAGSSILHPAFRPRANSVYFSITGRDAGIWRVPTWEVGLEQVTCGDDVGLVWDAAGETMAFFRRSEGALGHLVLLDAGDKEESLLPLAPGVYAPLEFLPGGRELRYLALSCSDGEVWTVEGCIAIDPQESASQPGSVS